MAWAAISIGLLGGLHCLGMCGPIAMALPNIGSVRSQIISKSLYNFGRIATYTILGGVVGGVSEVISISGWQQGLSILSGILLIVLILFSGYRKMDMSFLHPMVKLSQLIRKWFSRFLKKRSWSSHLVIGLINGLLPCGLVYVGVAGALSAGSIANGALFMFIFGLGTLPWMLSVSTGAKWLSVVWRNKLSRFIPVFVVILGCLFILRGLNLGIPYVSPDLNSSQPHPIHEIRD